MINPAQHIRYVARQNLDLEKWDRCIEGSAFAGLYALSFYLDHMAKNWDGLVLNDYEAVMPLTWKSKWGLRYLCQPPFVAHGGVFTHGRPTETMVQSFLREAGKLFRFGEIFLNPGSGLQGLHKSDNFVLALGRSYLQIRAGYNKDLLRNLHHAQKFDLQYGPATELGHAVQTYRELYGKRTPHVKTQDYERFENLCRYADSKGMLVLRKVCDQAGELLAIAILLTHNGRIFNLMSSTLPRGRDLEANHFLFDQLIGEFATSQLALDFEGSSLAGVANFYRKFGAQSETVFFWRHNELPLLLKRFKKPSLSPNQASS